MAEALDKFAERIGALYLNSVLRQEVKA
jgi:hypothetical protein